MMSIEAGGASVVPHNLGMGNYMTPEILDDYSNLTWGMKRLSILEKQEIAVASRLNKKGDVLIVGLPQFSLRKCLKLNRKFVEIWT